jgi:hypothetical protein
LYITVLEYNDSENHPLGVSSRSGKFRIT